ncbi:penicillin-binding protein 2 [Qipengyuania sp. JC766]|uniref:peptidoglycan D,D-transpeptidase FtsI family protein n=1 Tax=Qipengyuania sp. JC766 TaxID=3232139 RepID=UPI0034574D0B
MNAVSVSTTISAGRADRVTERRSLLLVARQRILLVASGFALVAMVALIKIGSFGFSERAIAATTLEEALLPPRGELTDRNGYPLARAFPAYALWFDPTALGEGEAPLVRSPREVAVRLNAIFPEMDIEVTAAKLASGRAGYLRRRVLPEDAERIHDLGEPALNLPQETERHYPQGSLGAHVLGYVDRDGIGRAGMERVLEERLTDPDLRDHPVALSIDMRVQGALEDELRRGMLAVDAKGAAGIVLDVDTGEVMALASLPEYDPNKVVAHDLMLPDEEAAEGGVPKAFNRVTNQVYELGSTFKPLTVAAAIDAGVVRDLGRPWNAAPVQVQGRTLRDSHFLGNSLNVPQTLIHSSNTVTARIADEMGQARLQRTLVDLGMSERPYIELPGRGKPIWEGGKWSRIKNMTVSYGHGVAVTPLHLASAYAAMVNGGLWRPATLNRLDPGKAPKGRRVFKESTSSRMRQLLRMITIYGTGKKADAPGYRVGGKTGSAEKPGVRGYRESSLISTFAAAFPMDKPRYVVVAMLDEPRGTTASSFQRTAAWNAAPIVGQLVPRIGPLLGVQPDTGHDVDISDLKPLVGDVD